VIPSQHGRGILPLMKKILIVQDANIGDFLMTQPLAAMLKRHYPGCHTTLIGREYIEEVVRASPQFDDFVSIANTLASTESDADAIVFASQEPAVSEWAARVGIPLRVAKFRLREKTARFCNKRLVFSYRHTTRHQTQSILKLLRGFDLPYDYSMNDIKSVVGFQFNDPPPLPPRDTARFTLIIHPGSQGSARDWPLAYFAELMRRLPTDKFHIVLTGIAAEAERFRDSPLMQCPGVTNLMGQLSLKQFLYFVGQADGLIANSTGPLHMAAVAGINTLGLFPPRAYMTPQRWGPVGPRAEAVVHRHPLPCFGCTKQPLGCACMQKISVAQVEAKVLEWVKKTS
jgi:heptosyltransferase-3